MTIKEKLLEKMSAQCGQKITEINLISWNMIEPYIDELEASQLEPLSYTAAVLAEYEDELPDYITDEDYKRMFPLSKVDIVRTFPYVVINGHKYYLKAV